MPRRSQRPTPEHAFCQKLKDLRGSITVQALADQRKVAASSIYKMESTARVKWETVETVYGPLCHTSELFCELLILWALAQSRQKPAAINQGYITRRTLEVATRQLEHHTERLVELLRASSAEDRHLLLRFSEQFLADQATRAMAAAWLLVTQQPETPSLV